MQFSVFFWSDLSENQVISNSFTALLFFYMYYAIIFLISPIKPQIIKAVKTFK